AHHDRVARGECVGDPRQVLEPRVPRGPAFEACAQIERDHAKLAREEVGDADPRLLEPRERRQEQKGRATSTRRAHHHHVGHAARQRDRLRAPADEAGAAARGERSGRCTPMRMPMTIAESRRPGAWARRLALRYARGMNPELWRRPLLALLSWLPVPLGCLALLLPAWPAAARR